MANELRIQRQVRFNKNSRIMEFNRSFWKGVSGTYLTDQRQAVGTTPEALDVTSDIATAGVMVVRNLDSSNYVLIGQRLRSIKFDSGVAGSGFTTGQKVTGGSSSAAGWVSYIEGNSTSGTLVLSDVNGAFTDNENITGAFPTQGTASANGTLSNQGFAPILRVDAGESWAVDLSGHDDLMGVADTAAVDLEYAVFAN